MSEPDAEGWKKIKYSEVEENTVNSNKSPSGEKTRSVKYVSMCVPMCVCVF